MTNIFWMKVSMRKITKSKAKKLYNKLIQKHTDALEREKSYDIRKYNILDILNNVGSILLALTCTTETSLKKQFLKEVLKRE